MSRANRCFRREGIARGDGVVMETQRSFLRFHETIKSADFRDNPLLRRRKRRLVHLLGSVLPQPFDVLEMGAFAMGTGTPTPGGASNIDLGLVFEGSPLRRNVHVYEALVSEALGAESLAYSWRESCVRIVDEPRTASAVDLRIYLKDERGALHLAVGKRGAASGRRRWRREDPTGFLAHVRRRFRGEEGLQFRRTIRYLKRWRDRNFSRDALSAPRGIVLTLAALHGFTPSRSWASIGSGPRTLDDLGALIHIVQWLENQTSNGRRLVLEMPVHPYDDVCIKLSEAWMTEFSAKLKTLHQHLNEARAHETLSPLREVFGHDFPKV